MTKPKQNYSPEFKSKLVLEVLAEEKTPLQIAVENGVHFKSLNKWVKEAKLKLPAIFKGVLLQILNKYRFPRLSF